MELVQQDPAATAILLVQDDVVFCKHTRSYLEAVIWPQPASHQKLYIHSGPSDAHLPTTLGFHRGTGVWSSYGGQACLFTRDQAVELLTDKEFISHRWQDARGHKVIDGALYRSAQRRGTSEFIHVPNLCQHIGRASALGHPWDRTGESSSFLGEEFDATNLLRAGATISYQKHIVLVDHLDAGEHIQSCWARGEFYEGTGLLAFLERHHPKNGVVVDVGANIGNHTLFFLRVMQAQRVIAIEPVTALCERIRTNVQLNAFAERCVVIEAALGDRNGRVAMKNVSERNIGNWVVDEKGTGTTVTTLDDVLQDEQFVDIIKVDIEHYNEPFLRGAEKTLRRLAPVVYIEAATDSVLAQTDRLLERYGYRRTSGLVLNATPTYQYQKSDGSISHQAFLQPV